MALHVELRTRELRATGLDDERARAQAEREVGRADDVAPRVARIAAAGDGQTARRQWLDEVRQDLKAAWRSSRRSPGFTALVLLTIAFGLGANAAIFGVVNVTLFTPLPFDPHNTLVRVRETRVTPGTGAVVNVDASRRTADAVAGMTAVFTDSVALSGTGRSITGAGAAIRVASMRVGPGFTRVAGITPMLGRSFTGQEEQAGDAADVVLISHRLWQSAFGARTDIIGHRFLLDGRAVSVVGVLPVNFRIPYDTDLYAPSRFGEQERSIFILARLASGVTVAQARAALQPVGEDLNRRFPDVMRGLGVTAVSAREFFVDDEDRLAMVLMGAVGVLLLIACSNVALLLTTRFASRRAEVVVRAALGCSRTRQIRQFVTEGIALFVVGGGLGFCLAMLLRDSLVVLLPENLATEVGFDGIPIDMRLVGVSTAIALVSGVVFGLMAALRTTGADLNSVMKSGGRSLATTASRGLLGTLVVGEVALAVTLLFTAGVMIEMFQRLSGRDLGFETAHVTTARVDFTAERYRSADARRILVSQLSTRLASTPGVEAVGATTVNPLCCGDWGARVVPEGVAVVQQNDAPIVQHFIVGEGYFETLQFRLSEGRFFTRTDGPGSEPVVIINRTMAEQYWPRQSALGKRVRQWTATGDAPWATIVGVVHDATENGEYESAWYLPHAQRADGPSGTGVHVMVRAASGAAIARAMREVVAEVDPALPLFDMTTMDALAAEALHQDRMGAWLSGAFGIAGLLLASLGLYGILTFVIAADRIEIAVRRVLGASAVDVVWLVLRRAAVLVGLGLLLGSVGAWGAARVVPHWFIEARPAVGLGIIAALLIVVAALLAIIAPIRRALRLDPLQAMRV
jgi:predicted permease